jgi:hypothetical protein
MSPIPGKPKRDGFTNTRPGPGDNEDAVFGHGEP